VNLLYRHFFARDFAYCLVKFSYCRYANVGFRVNSTDEERLKKLLDLSVSPSGRVKYNSIWRSWKLCCLAVNGVALPAVHLVFESFLANVAFESKATLARKFRWFDNELFCGGSGCSLASFYNSRS
jgi:hypothetical protein